jgi:S1-C subfamily serine protease
MNRSRKLLLQAFSSSIVRNKHLRSAIGAACLLLPAAQCLAGRQFDKAIYDAIKPSVILISCVSDGRSGTGFVWSSTNSAVTALHVVTGCQKIVVHYESLGVSEAASLAKISRRADLALLKIDNAPNTHIMSISSSPPSLTEDLSTLGYPLQLTHMESTSLRLRYGSSTLRNIVPQSVADHLSGGSPSLDLDVDAIEGHLLPGHSGAPIFDQNQRVVAIADGGLENGAAAISWGIPVKYLSQLQSSNEPLTAPQSAQSAVPHELFAAESETKNLGQFTCSGLVLTKLRTAPYSQLIQSVDDPIGLSQLIQFFAVNPTGFQFDIYQHLPSGATFALPAGAAMSADPQGDCVATLSSGITQIKLQLASLPSALLAQQRSLVFEQTIVGGNTQGWVIDPQWTNLLPINRFDGMIVRRRAYMHVQTYPMMFQDGYLFEALGERNNVFIGSAAIYHVDPALSQGIMSCRLTNFAGNCGEARTVTTEWVQSVLAIQLTTFPVG